jgi:hypothetical protein
MEPETSLVRTYSGVVLDSEAPVELDLTVSVFPRDAKLDDSLWLDYSL